MKNPILLPLTAVGCLTTGCYLLEVWRYGIAAPRVHAAIVMIIWAILCALYLVRAVIARQSAAQIHRLKGLAKTTIVRKLHTPSDPHSYEEIYACDVHPGDLLLLFKGEVVPTDGEIFSGAALVNESAVTGESAPVVRAAGGDVSALTEGTTVLSDSMTMVATQRSGEGVIARMVSLIEGGGLSQSPNEQIFSWFLSYLTSMPFLVVLCMLPVWRLLLNHNGVDGFFIVLFFVSMVPVTTGALLRLIGQHGMVHLLMRNLVATSSSALSKVGDVDVMVFDKTGTITFGNRQALSFAPVADSSCEELARAAYFASMNDPTVEGKSVTALSLASFPSLAKELLPKEFEEVPFSIKTRLSGMSTRDHVHFYFKGAWDALVPFVRGNGLSEEISKVVDNISLSGGTPLVVLHDGRVLGAIFLKDTVKPHLKERFSSLRAAGIQTVMVTGDASLTAAALAAETGLETYYGQVTPEMKLAIIQKYQEDGHIVAMTGDGSNDVPALIQADVAIAMKSGTQAAREASDFIDLENTPTKIIEIVSIGRSMVMASGVLTVCDMASGFVRMVVFLLALLFAIFPACQGLLFSSLPATVLALGILSSLFPFALLPLATRWVGLNHQTLYRHVLFFGVGSCALSFCVLVVFYHLFLNLGGV